jgi:hypothetical protein
MTNEWRKFNPKDLKTHPRDNSRVEMKYADGKLISGGYLKGHFLQGGVISVSKVDLTMRWRYMQ